jgi:cyclopropane-fatty-acyl-phospholipid synthase
VITCDMNDFATDERFDRIISVEMFEHMRNHRQLLERIHGWLLPGGRFFMHIFCHRAVPYVFEDRGPSDWMSRHFFSGGMMPSDDLPLRFQDHLKLVDRWRWNGKHYERTLNAWLANMDRNRRTLFPLLEDTYGKSSAPVWWGRWRIFFMACAELFGFHDGEQWQVSHYLFERPA